MYNYLCKVRVRISVQLGIELGLVLSEHYSPDSVGGDTGADVTHVTSTRDEGGTCDVGKGGRGYNVREYMHDKLA